MDVKVSWKISPKVETLIDAIVECKKQLTDIVKVRYPYSRSTKLRYCDAFASPKVCELLSSSKLWRDCKATKDDLDARRLEQLPHCDEHVADFELFRLVKNKIIGDENVRLVIEFETGDGSWETFFGNVELVSR